MCKWSWFLNNVDTSVEEMKYENSNVNIFKLKGLLLLLSNIHIYIHAYIHTYIDMWISESAVKCDRLIFPESL